jgi:NADH pyrophosphatase NudC (nudix superfamily)
MCGGIKADTEAFQLLDQRQLAWFSQKEAFPYIEDIKSKHKTLLFLGTLQDTAYFAFEVDDNLAMKFNEVDAEKEFPDMRLIAPTIKFNDAAILAQVRHNCKKIITDPLTADFSMQARAYFEWHARHVYCGTCGSKTESHEGGSRRKCTGCGTSLYPRTDPVSIVLVTSHDGQRCLLGRKKEFPKGIYTCIAGFMEPYVQPA